MGHGPHGRAADIVAAMALRSVASSGRASRAGPGRARVVVVTAGPTLEDIDPVRFLGNRSSGKMGFAIAEQRRGARGAR